MKRGTLLVVVLLLAFAITVSIAEGNNPVDEDIPEGLYVYSPIEGKILSWMENEKGNEYQIIGLAPHDTTVNLVLKDGEKTVWQGDVLSEGNGYFQATVPAEKLETDIQYMLNAQCLGYEKQVTFSAYKGSLSDFAADPLHIEILEGLTQEEKWTYESEMEEPSEEELLAEDILNEEELAGQSRIQTGPKEFRNKDFSYMIQDDETLHLTYYYGHERHLKIPEMVDGYKVSGINFSIFNAARGVYEVTIPHSVTNVEGMPFLEWCDLTAIYVPPDHTTLASVNGVLYSRNLKTLIGVPNRHPDKEMVVPEGTVTLDFSAFFSSSVRKVYLPETLRKISDSCFAYSWNLRIMDLPDSLRILEGGCLRNNGLNRIVIPSRAAVEGEQGICFGCRNLEDITVMPGNETACSIDGVLFSADKETLMTYPAQRPGKHYEIPSGTVRIGDRAFEGAAHLQSVTIAESVTTLGNNAFEGASIESVEIPDGVTELGDNPFYNCWNLTGFVISRMHPFMDAVDGKYLYSRDHKTFICYPSGLDEEFYAVMDGTQKIANEAFDTTKLKGIYLPEGLKTIGNFAFCASSVKSIYIPGTVEEMGNQILSYCDELETVGIGAGATMLADSMFVGSNELKGVSVPETVSEIGELAFLDTGSVRIFTVEGSFMHQYAMQNALNFDVQPGNYEKFTQSVKDGTDPLRETGYKPKAQVRIISSDPANIREKADLGSRRVGRATPGTVYPWLETVTAGNVTWYKIELEDGTEGFIASKMAELLDE
ncbi:MAG: leucine-rich repeat protein [Clostridia bacterium]|nr:leucine-rich repeat protein [Clostridia bacterium]